LADLIKALIQVKDPLTLAAFLSAVLLVAFRTRKVPEMFFELLKEKLTKERFAQVLQRFMVLGFSSLCVLCAVAVTGQVLARRTQAQPLSLQDLRTELATIRTTDEKSTAALNSYAEGLARINAGQIAQAIAALQKSVDQVPSLTANYTLAYLFQREGNPKQARQYAVKASALAQMRGDILAAVSMERLANNQAQIESSATYYSYSFGAPQLGREWRVVNPDPARWVIEPRNQSIMIITHLGPCPSMKDGKNLLLLEKQLPTDDFEVIVKASIQLDDGVRLAMVLFNDEANYFWMTLERGSYNLPGNAYKFAYFQKIFQGQLAGSYRAESGDHVYLKIDRDGDEYTGSFASIDPTKLETPESIQWTKLGTLPWIRFQGKLALCAVNAWGNPPEVAAQFYSVLIRRKH